jgi:hypothetical protein
MRGSIVLPHVGIIAALLVLGYCALNVVYPFPIPNLEVTFEVLRTTISPMLVIGSVIPETAQDVTPAPFVVNTLPLLPFEAGNVKVLFALRAGATRETEYVDAVSDNFKFLQFTVPLITVPSFCTFKVSVPTLVFTDDNDAPKTTEDVNDPPLR